VLPPSSGRWWRQHPPPKRRSTYVWLHGSTSQKTLNFVLSYISQTVAKNKPKATCGIS
jgi:hypothetical protein